MTNQQLFRDALAKVKSLNGSAKDKADFFEREAERIKQLTGGSWSAHRLEGANGEHVFLGQVGDMLIIDTAGQLYRGRIQSGMHRFLSPNKLDLDYNSLRPA